MNDYIQVIKSGLCIGCGYCTSHTGGSLTLGSDGFLVPNIQQLALNQDVTNLVNESCPGLCGSDVIVSKSFCQSSCHSDGGSEDYMWGKYWFLGTGFSTNPDIRHNGSSGGVITGLAKWLVSTGRVDRVLITTYDDGYPIGTASHLTDESCKIMEGAGSKYCPASPLAVLNEARNNPGRYAIVGRPCDIATLRRAMRSGDPVSDKLVLLIAFFCAGTPSDTGNRQLLKKLGVDDTKNVTSFRHRGQGWPGLTTAILNDGSEKSCSYNESWGNVLRRHVHKLCKICPDGIGEQADLVAADAWYGDDGGYPAFTEAEGRSLVIARTRTGHEILVEAENEGVLWTNPLDVREIDRMQPGQISRRRQLRMRVLAYRLMGYSVPKYNLMALRNYEIELGTGMRVKILVGTLRRLMMLKLNKLRWKLPL